MRLVLTCFCSHFRDGREWVQQVTGIAAGDSAADQDANKWGRNGRDSFKLFV